MLTASLDGQGGEPLGDERIRFYAKVEGSPLELVETRRTDAEGRVTLTLRPRSTATYSATFPGTSLWSSSESDKEKVFIEHALSGQMLREQDQQGRYAIYGRNARVFYGVTHRPVHRGTPITIRLQVGRGGGWRNGGSASFRQDPSGRVVIYFDRAALPPGRYRLAASSSGDRAHVAGRSGWSYFRVQGGTARLRPPAGSNTLIDRAERHSLVGVGPGDPARIGDAVRSRPSGVCIPSSRRPPAQVCGAVLSRPLR